MKPIACIASRVGCVAFALTASACSSNDSSPDINTGGGPSTSHNVEIFSWWVAPGEAEAWQALVDVNKRLHPNDHVFNAAAASGNDARAQLALRFAANTPPDLFQQNAHEIGSFLQTRPNSLQALDGLLAKQQLTGTIWPEILRDVSVDGKAYGMPVNIHRENSLFYNRQLFADNGLQPPDSVTSFLETCRALKEAKVTPIALVFQGWVLRILFNEIAMGSMGSEKFQALMSEGTIDEQALKAAIDIFDEVLQNYVNEDAANPKLGWTDAAEMVSDGRAAMFLHGDWAKGYYVQLGWTPGIDFGVSGAPGATDMFWYGVDTFSLPVGAKQPDAALDFLSTVGTLEGQVAFNKLKGSTPIRMDVPRSELDTEGQRTLDDFTAARYRTFAVNQAAWDDAMVEFATTHDKEALFQTYLDHPPK